MSERSEPDHWKEFGSKLAGCVRNWIIMGLFVFTGALAGWQLDNEWLLYGAPFAGALFIWGMDRALADKPRK